MSNNAPDYENDLVFPPASADVRTTTIEKQLEIAIKALEFYEKPFACFHPEYNVAQHHKKAAEALAKIKELDK